MRRSCARRGRLDRASFLARLLGPLNGTRVGSAEFLAGLFNRARLDLPLLLDRPRLFDGPRLELRGLFEPPGLLRGRRLLNGPCLELPGLFRGSRLNGARLQLPGLLNRLRRRDWLLRGNRPLRLDRPRLGCRPHFLRLSPALLGVLHAVLIVAHLVRRTIVADGRARRTKCAVLRWVLLRRGRNRSCVQRALALLKRWLTASVDVGPRAAGDSALLRRAIGGRSRSVATRTGPLSRPSGAKLLARTIGSSAWEIAADAARLSARLSSGPRRTKLLSTAALYGPHGTGRHQPHS